MYNFFLIKSLNRWTVGYNPVQVLHAFFFSSSTYTRAMQICHFSCSFYSSFMLLVKMLDFIPCIVHTQQGFYHLEKSNLLDAQLFPVWSNCFWDLSQAPNATHSPAGPFHISKLNYLQMNLFYNMYLERDSAHLVMCLPSNFVENVPRISRYFELCILYP